MLCNVIMLLLLYVHVCVTRTGWKTRPRPKTVILSIKKSNQIKSNLFLSSPPPLSLSHARSCARSLFCSPPPPPPFLVLECLALPVRLTVSAPLPHCFFLSAPVCISLPNRQTGRQTETQKQTHAHTHTHKDTHTHTHTHMVVKSLDWGVYQSNM